VGQERLGPSYFFIPLVLGPLNSLVWWEVPLGYIALRSFLFLQEQIKDIIIIICDQALTLEDWDNPDWVVRIDPLSVIGHD
jgi:hypothetical protein